MKKIITFYFLLILFIFISSYSIAQKDSVCRNHISVNLAAGLISGEVGLYYDRRLSDKYAFQLSYGHRFYSFYLVQSGASGPGILYLPQQADIIRIGLKKYFRLKRHGYKLDNTARSPIYFNYRLSYWNLHTPKYTNRNGPNGENDILREVVSEDFNVLNFVFGIGKEFKPKKNLFVDLFATAGLSVGQLILHKYSYRGDDNEFTYNDEIRKGLGLLPVLELGCKVGFGW